MSATYAVRFFERNDKIKKHLLRRVVVQGDFEKALATAYHTIKNTSPERIDTLVSVEVELISPALVPVEA